MAGMDAEREGKMSEFLTQLNARLKDDDRVWVIDSPLIYVSDILGKIEVPQGFETDFASVPRVPIAYMAFGDRAHREAVIHDYLYRTDSTPQATYDQANSVFLEAMEVRGKPWWVRKMMYWGVCCGGFTSYHKKCVGDCL
jgi:hypothetical protein